MSQLGRKSTAILPRETESKERFGFLGRALWESQDEIGDDRHEYLRLWEALRLDLRPRGALEEVLVEIVASCILRKQRILRAERGIVYTRQQDVGGEDRDDRHSGDGWFGYDEYEEARRRASDRERDTRSVVELLSQLQALEGEIREQGQLSKTSADHAAQFWNAESPNAEPLGQQLRRLNRLATGSEKAAGEAADPKEYTSAMLAAIDAERERLLARQEELGRREAAERHAKIDAHAVPDHQTVRTLAMHGRRLDQELRVALNQLERLQRARLGEALYGLSRFVSTASGPQLQRLKKLTLSRLTLESDAETTAMRAEAVKVEGV
jgi:hypothetical protein